MDLFFRKIVRDNGRAFGALLTKIKDFAAADGGNGRLKAERAALAEARRPRRGHARAMVGFLMASAEQPAEVYKAGLNTTRLLMALGNLVIGWLLLPTRRSRRPGWTSAPATPGTVTSTRASWPRAGSSPPPCCPGWRAERKILEETTLDLMELPERRLLSVTLRSRTGPRPGAGDRLDEGLDDLLVLGAFSR